MAKIVKRKRRKIRLEGVALLMFVFALVATMVSNLFVSSMNASLMIDIQNMKVESETLKTENKKLNMEIQTLQNKDRVYTIAQDAGLQQNQDNVVSVTTGE